MNYFPKLAMKRPQDLAHGELVICQSGLLAFAWYFAPVGNQYQRKPVPDFVDLPSFNTHGLRGMAMQSKGDYFASITSDLEFRYKPEDIAFGGALAPGDLFVTGVSECRENTYIALREPESGDLLGFSFDNKDLVAYPHTDIIAIVHRWTLILKAGEQELTAFQR